MDEARVEDVIRRIQDEVEATSDEPRFPRPQREGEPVRARAAQPAKSTTRAYRVFD